MYEHGHHQRLEIFAARTVRQAHGKAETYAANVVPDVPSDANGVFCGGMPLLFVDGDRLT
jgi:hypothetical protein